MKISKKIILLFSLIAIVILLLIVRSSKTSTDVILIMPEIRLATFAGGCFWCIEAPFQETEGVTSAVSGYIGGEEATAEYEQVVSGNTGHREAVEITFDDDVVSYKELVELFLRQIDPTDSGGQFADRGHQYTTAIYYQDDKQKEVAEQVIAELAASEKFDAPIATEILPVTTFYPAEGYHQDYYLKSSAAYERYEAGSGRKQFKEDTWTAHESPAQDDHPESPEQKSEAQAMEGGIYIEGTPDDISNYPGKRIVLFFHASWCPSCRKASKDIQEHASEIPDDLVIIKLDYDEYRVWGRKTYDVAYQHTFIQVDSDGNLITKWPGGSFEDVLRNVKE